MTNPFTGKSLTELRDGVPGCSDDDLNALCACVCCGEWVRWIERHLVWPGWFRWGIKGRHGGFRLNGEEFPYRPTTDLREVGRLLTKYSYSIMKDEASGTVMVVLGWLDKPTDSIHKWNHSCAGTGNPCRVITEAAVVAGLTKMIKEEASNDK